MNNITDRDYSPYCSREADYKVAYTDLQSGVSLFTISFKPYKRTSLPVVVFIPGLASVIDNFKDTLIGLTRNQEVHYVETREKSTAVISRDHGFSVAEIATDIIQYLENKFTENERYILVGYSLGATAIIEAFRHINNKPERIILIEPNAAFNFPRWSLILARVAEYVFIPVKPFLKWYIRKFRVNTSEDYEMYLINCRILDAAEPRRLGHTIRALKSYNMGDCVQELSVPVMVVGASKDIFHSHDDAMTISQKITGCRYVNLENNRRTHSEEAASLIVEFMAGADNK